MGNCLALQENIIKVMNTDGKILEYKAPIKVQQILSDFSGHAIFDSLQYSQYLQPETKLLGSRLYHLVPLPLPSPQVKKKVSFSIPEEEGGHGSGLARIKLVISKQELHEILRRGRVSVDDMASRLQGQKKVHKVDTSVKYNECWKPVLESIPEIN